jgi:hypothetical protein
MNTTLSALRKLTEDISNPEGREISKVMAVLLATLEVGPNADNLANKTGYPLDFLKSIVARMRHAGLWAEDAVDDREWWTADGELDGAGLYAHALVALGKMKREKTSRGAQYLDTATGEIAREWRSPDGIH